MIYAVNKKTKEHEIIQIRDIPEFGSDITYYLAQADADGWIGWSGGECPLPEGAPCEVQYANGQKSKGGALDPADNMEQAFWRHDIGNSYNIIAYRLILGENTMTTTAVDDQFAPDENEWDGEGLTTNMQQSLADQLETAIATLADAQQNVDRLREEYRAAYPLIHGVVEPGKDMTDPSNWRAGDVFKYIGDETDWYTQGKEYMIKEDGQGFYVLDDDGEVMRAALEDGDLEFVRRP